MKQSSVAALCAAVMISSGCVSMAPHYERPATPVPDHWPTGPAYGKRETDGARAAADIVWSDFVLDERLRQVIDQALRDSRDLRQQAAAVVSARAQYRLQRASVLPTIDATASGSKARVLTSTDGTTNTKAIEQSYSATVGLSSYEIDLFGRLRSLSDAAQQTYLASAATARATRISLIAETATAWLTLAADRNQLKIAQETAASAERSTRLTRRRLENGVASAVDVHEAETIYQQARADAASYATTIEQDRNALELLVGSPVADNLLPEELPDQDAWFADVPAGLSSQVLLQRPDVLAAEHQLRSANANIGAARAAFFPTVTLTGDGGLASASLNSLVSHGSSIWSVAPNISLPLFAGGANRANLNYAKSQKTYYIATYELAVQTAFKEVADALARRGTMAEQLAAEKALVDAASESYRLADARYSKGVDTYLNALDSQRTLYSAQSALVTDRLIDLSNRVTLYKVLGGGLADKSG